MSETENGTRVPDTTPRQSTKKNRVTSPKRISLNSLQFVVIPASRVDRSPSFEPFEIAAAVKPLKVFLRDSQTALEARVLPDQPSE